MSMDSVTGAQFLASLSQCSSPRVPDSDQMSIRSEDDGGCPTKVKLMCSYGGRIMPRPHDAQLRYIGGDTRILVVNRNISFADLSVKLSKLCGGRSMFAKYKLPYEDFDALVSVICDEDLETMMEEYDRLEAREAPSRLRLFLFPKNSHINNVMGSSSSFQLRFDSKIGSSTAEQRFLDALNSNDEQQQQQQEQQIVMPSSELPDFLFGFDPVAAAQEVIVETNSPNNSLKMIIEADSAMQSGLPPICTAPAARAVLVPPPVLQPQLIPQMPQNMPQSPQMQAQQNVAQSLPQVSQNLPQAQQNLPQQAQQNLPQAQQSIPQQTLQQNRPQPQLQQTLQQNQPQPQLQQTLQQNMPQPQLQQQQQNQQQQVLPPRGPKVNNLKSDKKEPKNNKDAGSPKKSEHKMNSNDNRQIQVQKESFDQPDAQPSTSPDSMKIKQRSLDASPEISKNDEAHAVDEHEPVKVREAKHKQDVVDNKQQDGEGKQKNAANPNEGSIERQEVSLNVYMEQQKLQEAQLQHQEQLLKMENKTCGDEETKKTQLRQEQVFGIQQHRLEDYTQQQQHLLKQQHLLMQQQNQQMVTLSPQQQQQFQQHQLHQFQHQPYFIENNVIYFLADNQQQQQQQIIQRPVLLSQDGVPIQRVSSDPLGFPRQPPLVAPQLPRQMSAQFVDQVPKQQVPSHVRVYPVSSARMSPSRFCEPPPPQQQQQQFEVAPAMMRAQVQPQQAFIIRQPQQQQGGGHVIDPRMVAPSQQMAFATSEKI